MLSNLLADVNQFLPTPSHGGRLTKWLSRPRNMNFYPRPHMEGDLVSVKSNLVKNISTHALTWRATVFVITNTIFPQDFYPRPHMEGDGRLCPCPACRPSISTHALTWRATSIVSYSTVRPTDFYPRPHMEGDSKHAEVQACISAAYLKCSTCKAAASRRCAGLGGRAVLFHQLSRLVLGRAWCEPRGEGMCDRGSHRQSGRRKGLKTHSSKMSSWLH